MKKLLLIFLALFLPLNLSSVSVKAVSQAEYLLISLDNAPVYYDEQLSNLICYIPKTYYVKKLGETLNAYHVEFGASTLPKIDGFVPKEFLSPDSLNNDSDCYPLLTLTTSDGATLYSDHLLSSPIQYLFKNRSMNYYGFYKSGNAQTVYFVSYNGKLGYIKEDALVPFSIPNHPNSIEMPMVKPDISEEKIESDEPKNYFWLKVAVYACLALAGIIALVVALKPKKQKDKTSYYDENEYE